MTGRACFTLTIAGTLLVSSLGSSAADEGKRPFSLEFSTGIEYDSTVAVLDLDRSSGQSDVAGRADLKAAFDKNLTDRFNLRLGYDFSQSLHDRFDEFDIRLHRGSTGFDFDLGPVKAGATLQYADAALDDDRFLVLKQVSPHLSRLFGKRLFVRLAWARTEKEFTSDPGRDATAESPSADLFVLLDGTRRYLVFGYQHHDEDALDDAFDYRGSKIKAQLSRRLARGSREITLKTELRYESRSYREPWLPIRPARSDRRYRFEAGMDVSLSRRGFLRAVYEYADNRSNVSSVNFDEHVVSVALGAKL